MSSPVWPHPLWQCGPGRCPCSCRGGGALHRGSPWSHLSPCLQTRSCLSLHTTREAVWSCVWGFGLLNQSYLTWVCGNPLFLHESVLVIGVSRSWFISVITLVGAQGLTASYNPFNFCKVDNNVPKSIPDFSRLVFPSCSLSSAKDLAALLVFSKNQLPGPWVVFTSLPLGLLSCINLRHPLCSAGLGSVCSFFPVLWGVWSRDPSALSVCLQGRDPRSFSHSPERGPRRLSCHPVHLNLGCGLPADFFCDLLSVSGCGVWFPRICAFSISPVITF